MELQEAQFDPDWYSMQLHLQQDNLEAAIGRHTTSKAVQAAITL